MSRPSETISIGYVHSEPVITRGTPGTGTNRYGFEGGRALKLEDGYHIFTTEMAGNPIWAKTRLAHWHGTTRESWKRVGTVFESSGDFTGSDTRACLWSPMPTYDTELERWVLTYVCYRSKPNTPASWYRNYDGRIALAVSQSPGRGGIAGPYHEKEIVLAPGEHSAAWEGTMGIDSFYPFRTEGGWLAWYGSSPESNGLASAPSLHGPWSRLSVEGPVTRHTENPVVDRLDDGRYIAVFDGCGSHRKMGYMLSPDGLVWSAPRFFDFDGREEKWWALSRTPLGVIHETDGSFTVFFTAYNRNFYETAGIWAADSDDVFDGYFASVGYFTIPVVA